MSNDVARGSLTRRRTHPVIGLAFLVACCMMIGACATTPPVVKIGLAGPFTGRHREIGYDVIYSARLAIREINEAGGIGPYRIALVALDDFGDPEMARKSAETLSRDPAMVAIIGHWLPETTLVSRPIYDSQKLAFVATGDQPFGYQDPDQFSPEFRSAYEELTPFEEVAGPYAGSAYEAIQLIMSALEQAEDKSGRIDRKAVQDALESIGSKQ